MASLAFDLLDRHVVDGLGDDIACTDASGTLTFAQLLERSAALAGGLAAVGVQPGDEVGVEVSRGNLRVVIVCACVRLGAVPSGQGAIGISAGDDRVLVRTGDDEIDLALLAKAGATEPAPALESDPPGYADAVRATFAGIIDPLLAGESIV